MERLYLRSTLQNFDNIAKDALIVAQVKLDKKGRKPSSFGMFLWSAFFESTIGDW